MAAKTSGIKNKAIGIASALAGAAVSLLTMTLAPFVCMPGQSYRGPLPALTEEQVQVKKQLNQDLAFLCRTIGERNTIKKGSLECSADYIAQQFEACAAASNVVKSRARVERQFFDWDGYRYQNVILEILGDTNPQEILVVGAHYDTVASCAGADDNGSGTVGVMALARIFARQKTHRTLRFVAFPNEEFYFRSRGMGSYQYAERCKARNEKIIAMLSLETIGFFSSAKGSQSYPPPLNMIYPDTGDFIAFVGDLSNRKLVSKFVRLFRDTANFPSEGLSAPAFVPGIDWSDHLYFAQLGYPALMVTDTAFYRNSRYHQPQDNLESIDFDRMTRVITGLANCLARFTESLTVNG